MAKAKDFKHQGNGVLSGGLYGQADRPLEKKRERKERVERINVAAIHPDIRQPRRAIPSVFRTGTIDGLLKWIDAVETYLEIDRIRFIEDDELELTRREPSMVTSLLQLASLARDIRDRGLTNPITVTQEGEGYLLETGERRWLAYYWLSFAYPDGFGGNDYDQIPARIVNDFDVWRQASENNARDDLNAIGKARQLAILLMDLTQGDHHYHPIQTFEHERDFYAQADIDTPYGSGGSIARAMGVKSRQRVNQYRQLLRLHPDIWTTADDMNVPEKFLRDLPSNVEEAMREIARRMDTAIENVNPVDSSTPTTPPTKTERFLHQIAQNRAKIEKFRKVLDKNPVGEGDRNSLRELITLTISDLESLRDELG